MKFIHLQFIHLQFIHLLIASAVALIPTPALAETWIAECNNVQFNFNRDSESYLVYFNTDSGIYQVAEGEITFDNGTAVRGPVEGNAVGNDGKPVTQIGLNPSRDLVYVFYQHPYNDQQDSGTFCNTDIDRVE
ncbi:hypothetical protein PN462_01990 [Spirulina sp. CS-785/01]|uniref:hypothetical protein n=1 Tax=Spirulina sp. CS-785/01 TaxID=3021716 RepID=UPI00232A965E|nr:hypothetical protein [Spirulina sp. CS-785/01]MDB9311856.1 hypothetical protein [Spirulina sp. CS-785/01]